MSFADNGVDGTCRAMTGRSATGGIPGCGIAGIIGVSELATEDSGTMEAVVIGIAVVVSEPSEEFVAGGRDAPEATWEATAESPLTGSNATGAGRNERAGSTAARVSSRLGSRVG